MKTRNTKTTNWADLAQLLVEIMVEESASDLLPKSFAVSKDAKTKTAKALRDGYFEKEFSHNDNGELYYAGMTEDYGGYISKEIEAAKLNQFRAELKPIIKKDYGLGLNDVGADEDGLIQSSIDSGETPQELSDRIGRKYDLNKLSEYGL